jgi:hypothetical protein
MIVQGVVVFAMVVTLAGCSSGSFLGNPSKQTKYQQPDLRQDGLTTMDKAEKE